MPMPYALVEVKKLLKKEAYMDSLKEIIFSVSESLDGGFEAIAVGHSIFTQCDDYFSLEKTLRDAVKCHFDEDEMPSLFRVNFIRNEVYAV